MSYIIALAGKGGTGKTTIAALLIRILAELKKGSVLAVDADPNSNLGEALGIEAGRSVGEVLDFVAANPDKVPSGMTKDRFVSYEVQSGIAEGPGFDLLTMGRPEGPGCYCYVNNVLRDVITRLISSYDYVVIDNEAGLEHLSRRTRRRADTLLVVSDATSVGLRAAGRISRLADELKIQAGKRLLLINRCPEQFKNGNEKDAGLEFIGTLAYDAAIEKISLSGGSLAGLDSAALFFAALRKLGDKIWN